MLPSCTSDARDVGDRKGARQPGLDSWFSHDLVTLPGANYGTFLPPSVLLSVEGGADGITGAVVGVRT